MRPAVRLAVAVDAGTALDDKKGSIRLMFPLLLPSMMLSLVPGAVLFAGAVWLLWGAYRQRGREGVSSLMLLGVALSCTIVASLRVFGMSLVRTPLSVPGQVAVEPRYEAWLLGLAALLLVVGIQAWWCERTRQRSTEGSEAFLGWHWFWAVVLLVCLGFNSRFLYVQVGSSHAVAVPSPDHRTEACLVAFPAFFGRAGYVLHRTRGARLWQVCLEFETDWIPCDELRLRWSPDSKAMAMESCLGNGEVIAYARFTRSGERLVETGNEGISGFLTDTAHASPERDPGVLIEVECHSPSAKDSVIWSVAVDSGGWLRWEDGRMPCAQHRVQLTHGQLQEVLRAVASMASYPDVAREVTGEESFEARLPNRGGKRTLRYSARIGTRLADSPPVQAFAQLLRSLQAWVPLPRGESRLPSPAQPELAPAVTR